MPSPTPFSLDVPQSKLDAITSRVRGAVVPPAPDGAGWAYGVDPDYLRRLAAYWVDGFDWRKAESALNQFPQFTAPVTIEDKTLTLHFYHVRSPRVDATPLLLCHGWPGSVFEFLHLIEPLTNPPEGEPAFHVVVPSLPGYGFSESYDAPLSPRRIGAYFASLMTDVLGYDDFLAQGGDWGSFIVPSIGLDSAACKGIHINMSGWTSPGVGPETEDEQSFAGSIAPLWGTLGAYANIQFYRTLSIGITTSDSPLGWAGWVLDKFHEWSDVAEEGFEAAYTMDQMLTNIMIYLVSDSVASSFWPYRGIIEDQFGEPIAPGTRVEKPTAIAKLPHEVPLYSFPPRSQVERSYNIVQWTEFPAGGHFAALEQPELLLADIRKFANTVD